MKSFYNSFLVAVFFFSYQQISIAQNGEEQQHKNEKHHLLSIEYDWLAAEIRLDTLFIANLLDSSFMGISEYGVHTKEEELADMYNSMQQRKRKNIRIDTFEIYDGMVNIYANTAVVTFIMNTFRNENGIPIQRRTRFYDVWVKKEGRWLAVSSQGSSVKE